MLFVLLYVVIVLEENCVKNMMEFVLVVVVKILNFFFVKVCCKWVKRFFDFVLFINKWLGFYIIVFSMLKWMFKCCCIMFILFYCIELSYKSE